MLIVIDILTLYTDVPIFTLCGPLFDGVDQVGRRAILNNTVT
jgi:hypothetical protein